MSPSRRQTLSRHTVQIHVAWAGGDSGSDIHGGIVVAGRDSGREFPSGIAEAEVVVKDGKVVEWEGSRGRR